MSDRQGIPLKLINTTLGPKEVEFKRQEQARFGRSPLLPGAGDLIRACAMVDVALNENESIRPLWLDIICAWDKPGCAAYCGIWLRGSDNLQKLASLYQEELPKPEPKLVIKALNELAQAYNEWRITFKQDADITYLRVLIDEFILKAFNGPINPVLRRVLGAIEYLRKPKSKIQVTPDKTRPVLKQAIAFCPGVTMKVLTYERLTAREWALILRL